MTHTRSPHDHYVLIHSSESSCKPFYEVKSHKTCEKTHQLIKLQTEVRHWMMSYFLLVATGMSFLIGCSSTPKNQVIPGPPIPGLNLTGGYDCLQFGFMKLKQSNNVVRGTYDGVRGGDRGTVVGKIEGDLLWIDWVTPGNLDNAQLPQKGKGWLRITQRGKKLIGKWGEDISRDNGGDWVAERSEFYE